MSYEGSWDAIAAQAAQSQGAATASLAAQGLTIVGGTYAPIPGYVAATASTSLDQSSSTTGSAPDPNLGTTPGDYEYLDPAGNSQITGVWTFGEQAGFITGVAHSGIEIDWSTGDKTYLEAGPDGVFNGPQQYDHSGMVQQTLIADGASANALGQTLLNQFGNLNGAIGNWTQFYGLDATCNTYTVSALCAAGVDYGTAINAMNNIQSAGLNPIGGYLNLDLYNLLQNGS